MKFVWMRVLVNDLCHFRREVKLELIANQQSSAEFQLDFRDARLQWRLKLTSKFYDDLVRDGESQSLSAKYYCTGRAKELSKLIL